MALAFGIVARNPYQSTSQKVVQARMWAQGALCLLRNCFWKTLTDRFLGLTVALLVGSAMATGFDASNNSPPVQSADHSWRRMLGESQLLEPNLTELKLSLSIYLEHDEHLTPEERAQLRDTRDLTTAKEIQKAVSQRKAAAAQA